MVIFCWLLILLLYALLLIIYLLLINLGMFDVLYVFILHDFGVAFLFFTKFMLSYVNTFWFGSGGSLIWLESCLSFDPVILSTKESLITLYNCFMMKRKSVRVWYSTLLGCIQDSLEDGGSWLRTGTSVSLQFLFHVRKVNTWHVISWACHQLRNFFGANIDQILITLDPLTSNW